MKFLNVTSKHIMWYQNDIIYSFGATPFGRCCIAAFAAPAPTVCYIAFVQENDQAIINDLWHRYRQSTLVASEQLAYLFEQLFDFSQQSNIEFIACGTLFQINVWKALTNITAGQVTTYQYIAQQIGQPKAVRAVAQALARNPLAYIIPCHRVMKKSGDLGGYRWGVERKKALLDFDCTASQ